MTHTYQLTGMTCSGCEAKVKNNLLLLPDVTSVEVSKDNNSAVIGMSKHIATPELQAALGGANSKYQIAETASVAKEMNEESRTWFETYKPIVLIFAYITGISLWISWNGGHVNAMSFMQVFMAGFFLVFSFFKMLNLKGFAESYAMYDIIAKKIPAWGYVYAFVELALGIAFATGFNPLFTNCATLIVMTISILGVLESVINKKKIQCACLGAVFNLPMSTLTIIEDAVMIAMSAGMILLM
jgi:cation transport ATPase